jgi:2'-5' RNA ligase
MSFRGFLAAEVDPLPPLRNLQRELEATGADLTLVDPDQFHVTLTFLGGTPKDKVPGIVEAAEAAVDGVEPHDLEVAGAGAFPDLSYLSVVWAGIANGEAVTAVAEELEERLEPLGFEPEDRDFHPHVTLARVQSGRAKARLVEAIEAHQDETWGTTPWNRVVLMRSDLQSDGPVYTVVEEIPLEG